MIQRDDFDITIGETERGIFVRVFHKPTGIERIADPVAFGAVGKIRDSLIAELRGLLFDPNDIRLDIGRAVGGDFIAVVHIPTGIHRRAMRRDRTYFELLDEVLEELHSGRSTDCRSG